MSDVDTCKLLMDQLDQGIVNPELNDLVKQAKDLGIEVKP